jgi:hypothetical protein
MILPVLITPLIAAIVLALLPGYKISARLNVLACLLSLLFAIRLLWDRPPPAQYLFIDDMNVVFIVLSTFVGFTTSAFSASYIGHELQIGRLTPGYLRFYHAMYQVMMLGMNLALVANNIGLMWVALEIATLTTVMMVGIYRTPEAIEAASVSRWRCLARSWFTWPHAQCLAPALMRWSGRRWSRRQNRSTPPCSTSPSFSCCWAMAPRSVWRRCTPGCPTPTPKVRPRFPPCYQGFFSTSPCMRCCDSR